MNLSSDFQVDAIAEGRMPNTPRYRLKITSQGTCTHWYQEHQKTNAKIVKKEFSLDKSALEKIYSSIKKNNFFELRSHDSGIVDGDQAQITVNMEGRSHTVLLINYSLREFDDIFTTINQVIPREFQIFYNSLIMDKGKTNSGAS